MMGRNVLYASFTTGWHLSAKSSSSKNGSKLNYWTIEDNSGMLWDVHYSHTKGTLLQWLSVLKCVLIKYSTSPQTSNFAIFYQRDSGEIVTHCVQIVWQMPALTMGTMIRTAPILFRLLLVNNWVFSVEHWWLWPSAISPVVWFYADNRGEVFCSLGGWSRYCIYNRSNLQKAKIHNISLILWTGHFTDASSKTRTKVHNQRVG